MTANSSWAAHDLFTIRRLSGLCDEIETIVNDRSLAEAVREAARATWQILVKQLELLKVAP